MLRAQARELTHEEIISGEIQRLIWDMRETMQDAQAVDLAAPQVGASLQVAVIEDSRRVAKRLAGAGVR